MKKRYKYLIAFSALSLVFSITAVTVLLFIFKPRTPNKKYIPHPDNKDLPSSLAISKPRNSKGVMTDKEYVLHLEKKPLPFSKVSLKTKRLKPVAPRILNKKYTPHPDKKNFTSSKTSSKTKKLKSIIADYESKVPPKIPDICLQYDLSFFIDYCPSAKGTNLGSKPLLKKKPYYKIPKSIELIAGLDEKEKGYVKRLNGVQALSRNLSVEQVKALLLFLHKRIEEDSLKSNDFNTIKNMIILKLLSQLNPPQELPKHLIAMFYDRSFDMEWRNSCLKLLARIYPSIRQMEVKTETQKLFWNAFKEDRHIAQTALLSLSALSSDPDFDPRKISVAALKLYNDEKAAYTIKITALQIATKFRNPEVVSIARNILKSSKNVNLKTSAIETLGIMGSTNDIKILESFTKSDDIRLKTASKAAIMKLKKT